MQQALTREEIMMPESVLTSRTALIRLGIGLMQGVFLYFLISNAEHWPRESYLYAPLLTTGVLAPVILIASLEHLTTRQTLIWMSVVVTVIAALSFFDVWRLGIQHSVEVEGSRKNRPSDPSPLFMLFSIAGLYIAHSLVSAGVAERRRIASYSSYFETAWKLGVQTGFSVMFVGVLWAVLWLGATLFMLVKLNFLEKLLGQEWFAIPVLTSAFAFAFHITDVRPAIVRGIRALLLVLLSWILPVAVIMVAGFLLSLPWTGLEPLWATRHATGVLLGTSAMLVVLINAAFQNGDPERKVPFIVRASARLAAFCLLPMTAIGIYSISLRVSDYGWTTDRVIAVACLLVASCYALGYAWAASRRGVWMQSITSVNVTAAFLVLAVLLALFSPIADPARISVADQMARLANGKVSAEEFDFDYLRFEGARYGRAALEQLKLQAQGPQAALIREKAELVMNKKTRWSDSEPKAKPADVAANLTVWPKTANLPASFLEQDWRAFSEQYALPDCLKHRNKTCDAYMIDFDGDNGQEVLLLSDAKHSGGVLMAANDAGKWEIVGTLSREYAGCAPIRELLQAGDYQLRAPRIKDIELGGIRIEMQPRHEGRIFDCKAWAKQSR